VPNEPLTSDQRAEITVLLRAAGCVFAEDEAEVMLATTTDPGALAGLVARRAAGLPLEHVVGWADFCGVRVAVAEGVFVPRPRTALLVREAAAMASGMPRPVVVDLCCGSGAIGVAVAARVPGIALHAADIEPAAVRCARANLGRLVPTAQVHEGDLFAALPHTLRGRVDVLVANVPYVPTGDLALMPAEARLHEPRTALDGGADGLAVLRRVAAGAARWLAPGGAVLMETSQAQRDAAVRALADHGLGARAVPCADLDVTAIIGRRPVDRRTAGR
jgi:release factor glutamine methyltransferase